MKEISKPKRITPEKCNRKARIMKVLMGLFCLCAISVTAENLYPQQKELSIDLRDVTLKNAIAEIEKASDYVFLITDEARDELDKKPAFTLTTGLSKQF